MRHRKYGWRLGRTTAHRLATLRNLATSLFEHERIQTTTGKAKALRPFAERLISLAKREGLHARRLVARDIHDRAVAKKLFDLLSARFNERQGGYVRLLHLGPRYGDGAEMSQVELVGSEFKVEKKEPKKKRRQEPTEEQAAGQAKASGRRPEGPEGGRDTGRPEHTHTRQHPAAGGAGRRDRGTGMTKKGQ